MLISPNHQFIFFKPMKSAGSSVEFNLLNQCSEEALCTGGIEEEAILGYRDRNNMYVEGEYEIHRFQSHTWPELFYSSIRYPHFYESYKKITTIRNPWDLVVSWYWWGRSIDKHDEKLININKTNDRKSAQQKFKNFLLLDAKHESIKIHGKFLSSTPLEYISMVNERFIDERIDVYVQFENLKNSYENLCTSLSIPALPLQRFKSKQRILSQHYSWYYTPETRKLISDVFSKTIETFGYTFDEVY